MDWARMLACITGTVDQELLLCNEYLTAENRILGTQLNGRLLWSNAEKKTLADLGHRLGRKALQKVTHAAQPDTIMSWYRLNAHAERWLRSVKEEAASKLILCSEASSRRVLRE